jgi:hypothetical protein
MKGYKESGTRTVSEETPCMRRRLIDGVDETTRPQRKSCEKEGDSHDSTHDLLRIHKYINC